MPPPTEEDLSMSLTQTASDSHYVIEGLKDMGGGGRQGNSQP